MFFLDYRSRASLISFRWKIEGSIWPDSIDRQIQSQGYCQYHKIEPICLHVDSELFTTVMCSERFTVVRIDLLSKQQIDLSSCISMLHVRPFIKDSPINRFYNYFIFEKLEKLVYMNKKKKKKKCKYITYVY